jgi:CMP/dCMP kinase
VTAAPVIAIDGAAGSGKSTLARGLAVALGLPYVNTGLMYRALAAAALEAGVSPDDAEALQELTLHLRYAIVGEAPPSLEVEGWPLDRLTTVEVERTVSAVARHPEVRERMRRAQRALGEHGAVMEGRDIATVVFPDASVKIFLHAEARERGARRADERAADANEVLDALHERDRRDARTNPLEPAPDAVVLDTSNIDVDAALEAALAIVRRRVPELGP